MRELLEETRKGFTLCSSRDTYSGEYKVFPECNFVHVCYFTKDISPLLFISTDLRKGRIILMFLLKTKLRREICLKKKRFSKIRSHRKNNGYSPNTVWQEQYFGPKITIQKKINKMSFSQNDDILSVTCGKPKTIRVCTPLLF